MRKELVYLAVSFLFASSTVNAGILSFLTNCLLLFSPEPEYKTETFPEAYIGLDLYNGYLSGFNSESFSLLLGEERSPNVYYQTDYLVRGQLAEYKDAYFLEEDANSLKTAYLEYNNFISNSSLWGKYEECVFDDGANDENSRRRLAELKNKLRSWASKGTLIIGGFKKDDSVLASAYINFVKWYGEYYLYALNINVASSVLSRFADSAVFGSTIIFHELLHNAGYDHGSVFSLLEDCHHKVIGYEKPYFDWKPIAIIMGVSFAGLLFVVIVSPWLFKKVKRFLKKDEVKNINLTVSV